MPSETALAWNKTWLISSIIHSAIELEMDQVTIKGGWMEGRGASEYIIIG